MRSFCVPYAAAISAYSSWFYMRRVQLNATGWRTWLRDVGCTVCAVRGSAPAVGSAASSFYWTLYTFVLVIVRVRRVRSFVRFFHCLVESLVLALQPFVVLWFCRSRFFTADGICMA